MLLYMQSIEEALDKLAYSRFRSSFHLNQKQKEYIAEKGMDVIESHARDFVEKRLAPARIENDGKQTPMKGHPVFIAQHATGCCCRTCLEKIHNIKKGRKLTNEEINYIIEVLMLWIQREMTN